MYIPEKRRVRGYSDPVPFPIGLSDLDRGVALFSGLCDSCLLCPRVKEVGIDHD